MLVKNKRAVNGIFRKITTEPKALLIYWMLQSGKSLPYRDIAEGIQRDFGGGLADFHSLEPLMLWGYLKGSLRGMTSRSQARNMRPGKRLVGTYKLATKGKADYKHLEVIAAHALWASAEISEQLREDVSLNQILYGAPWKDQSETGSPAQVAAVLSSLSECTELNVGYLSRLIGLDAEATTNHLMQLDIADYLRLYRTEERLYWLAEGISDLDAIIERNSDELMLGGFRVHHRGGSTFEKRLTSNPTCSLRIIDYLKEHKGAVSVEELRGNIEWVSVDGNKTRKYTLRQMQDALAGLYSVGIVDRIGKGMDGRARITDKGNLIATALINPVLAAVNGDTSQLKKPTPEQVHKAISNYEFFKYGKAS
ncbi:hypothetical protein KY360_04245 [Candidatus Woesearchaeota archaeon]|nr:hypothetical protein [Candidatus Woesearchaeota archaeon]